MPYAQVGKQRIFYAAGPGRGQRTLLAIHGSGGHHRHWPQAIVDLSSAHCIAVDLPGHGRSKGTGCQRVADYAGFVAEFIAALALDHVVLMGHSLGGAIVQQAALEKPAWLDGIILVGTGCRLRVSPAIIEVLTTDYPAAIDAVCKMAFGPETLPEMIQQAHSDFLNTPVSVTHGDYTACNHFNLTDRIGEISCPALVVSASDDRLTPIKYGEFLQKHIPGACLCIIENAGHMMAIEKPEAFTACVETFMRETWKERR
jgi:pimeloyl-ACP methyl ester carboxylesterase